MNLFQNNVLGGNKLHRFKATQVLRGPTQILIWGSEIAKGLLDKLRGGGRGGWSFGIKWGPKILRRAYINPNDAM